MPDENDVLDRRLAILEGQIRALREHVSDSGRPPHQVVRLLGQIRGGVDQVAALIAHRYLQVCLISLAPSGDGGEAEVPSELGEHVTAIRKIIGTAR